MEFHRAEHRGKRQPRSILFPIGRTRPAPARPAEQDLLDLTARARALDPSDENEVAQVRAQLAAVGNGAGLFPLDRPTRTAHEAGHALVSLALGGSIMRAHISLAGDSGGQVQHIVPLDVDQVGGAWYRLCVAVAGSVAERRTGIVGGCGVDDYLSAERDAALLVSAQFCPPGADDRDRATIAVLLRAAERTAADIIAARPHAFAAVRAALDGLGPAGFLRDPDLRPLLALDPVGQVCTP